MSGSVGEPARERSDGVVGPLYSALVIGRGPEAYELRRLAEYIVGRGATMDERRDDGRLETGESSTAESSTALAGVDALRLLCPDIAIGS